jgi:hypothetical protein
VTEDHQAVYLATHNYLDWVHWCWRCGKRLEMYTSHHQCGPATENYIRHCDRRAWESRRDAVKKLYRLVERGK